MYLFDVPTYRYVYTRIAIGAYQYATARTHLDVDTCVHITFCSVHSGVDDGNRSTPQAHNSS